MSEKPCAFLVRFEKHYPIAVAGIKADLKYGDAAAKASALKQAIGLIINGDTSQFRDLPVIIVNNVLPCEDLKVQKLVLLYLETVYKGADVFGRVPPDTTLVRDYLRRNLRHRDEYIRGLTLRFISRLAHPDLLEPIVESVLVNLYHRHCFVRRHAYSAIFAIHLQPKPNGRQLLPDALDRVEHELSFERDAAAMRNAFFMLCTCARERAVAYLLANAERAVTEWPDIVQVVAITLIHRACCSANKDRGKLIGIIISLSARSNSNSVIHEAADTLFSLCSESVAVCAATNAYFRLLFSQIDKVVKGIVLGRLLELGIKLDHSVKTISSLGRNVMNVKSMLAEKVVLMELAMGHMHNPFDIIGSASPNPNVMKILPIVEKVLFVELSMTQTHNNSVDTVCSSSANVMNIKSLPIAEKLLVGLATTQGNKLDESNECDTADAEHECGTKLMQGIHT